MSTRDISQRTPEQTSCQTDKTPSLADRFQQLFAEHITPETERFENEIVGYSIPLRLLRRFSSISCLNCYLCHSGDEYDPPEGGPIIAWSMNFIALMVDDNFHDNGTKICLVSEKWWTSERGYAPNIEDVGRTIILE